MLWTVGVDPAQDVSCYLTLLGGAEQARIGAMLRHTSRQHAIAAHALKRIMLTLATGHITPPARWSFTPGARGKPALRGAGPHFSLSHTPGLAACAMRLPGPVGVDVERCARPMRLTPQDRVFAPCERAWLERLAPAARAPAMLSLWTLKEAVLKAAGVGFAEPLHAIAFTLDPPRLVSAPPALPGWHVALHPLAAHVAAVAWRPVAAPEPLLAAHLDLDALAAPFL